MTSLVRSAAARYDELVDDPDALDAMGFAIEMNALKISASTLVVEIVGQGHDHLRDGRIPRGLPFHASDGYCATRTAPP